MTGLRPFFNYFGAKWQSSSYYGAPAHDLLIEPFAGAAGYALRYYERKVLLYDACPGIVALWKYLIRVKSSEVLRLPSFVPERVDDLRCCEEARSLIGFNIAHGQSSPRMGKPSSWYFKYSGSHWGAGMRARVAAQVEKIRHWRVFLRSYENIPLRRATWFVDPPYQVRGNRYPYGSRYIDYAHLGSWCRTLPGFIQVCENDGASWLPFQEFRTHKSLNNRGSKEVIWVHTK